MVQEILVAEQGRQGTRGLARAGGRKKESWTGYASIWNLLLLFIN